MLLKCYDSNTRITKRIVFENIVVCGINCSKDLLTNGLEDLGITAKNLKCCVILAVGCSYLCLRCSDLMKGLSARVIRRDNVRWS